MIGEITKDANMSKFTVGNCALERRLRISLDSLLLKKLHM